MILDYSLRCHCLLVSWPPACEKGLLVYVHCLRHMGQLVGSNGCPHNNGNTIHMVWKKQPRTEQWHHKTDGVQYLTGCSATDISLKTYYLLKGALDKYNIYFFMSNSIEAFKSNQYQHFQLILPMRFHFMRYFDNSIILKNRKC